MESTARAAIEFLKELGLINVLLPFLFVFIIVYAMLEKTRVLGTEKGRTKKNLNAMVAFVIGFIFIASFSHVESLVTYLQFMGMGLVALMTFFYIMAAFKQEIYFEKRTFFSIFGFIFIIVAFFYSLGLWNHEKYSFILNLIFNPIVLMVIVFYLIIMYITSDKPKAKQPQKQETRNTTEPKQEAPLTASPKKPSFDQLPFLRKLGKDEVPENLQR